MKLQARWYVETADHFPAVHQNAGGRNDLAFTSYPRSGRLPFDICW